MLRDVHAAFSAAVLQRRGEALRRCGALSDEEACSGEVWTGAEAARNGMIDGVGDMGPTLRRLYGQVPLPRCVTCALLMPQPRGAMRCAYVRRAAAKGLRRAQLRRAPLAARRACAGRHAARGHAAVGGAHGLRALYALMRRAHASLANDKPFTRSCQPSGRACGSFMFSCASAMSLFARHQSVVAAAFASASCAQPCSALFLLLAAALLLVALPVLDLVLHAEWAECIGQKL